MFSLKLTEASNWLGSNVLSAQGVPGWMLDTALQGTLLLVLASAVTFMMRRASGAQRHQVWRLAVAGLLVLPLLNIFVPRQLSLLPALQRQVSALSTSTQRTSPAADLVAQPATDTTKAQVAARATAERGTTDSASSAKEAAETAMPAAAQPIVPALWWALLAVACWGLGAVVAAGRLLGALRSVRRVEQQSVVLADGPLVEQAREAQAALGLKSLVTLRLAQAGSDVLVPLTWGWRRATVLLPAQAESWSGEQRRAILLHELAHVARADWAALVLAQAACVLYWFHPLVWWSARAMRAESEQATDDQVVASGIRAGDYGECLLQFVRMLRTGQSDCGQNASHMSLAVPMASPSTLENRLRALFDGKRSRRSLTRRQQWFGSLATVLTLTSIATIGVLQSTAQTGTQRQFALLTAGQASPSGPRIKTVKYFVTTTNDSGPGSLREAMFAAASMAGATIAFNIPTTDPGFKDGVFTIKVNSVLPVIGADSVLIDGASQTAATGDTNKSGPEVVISGDRLTMRTMGPGGAGIVVTAANCIVRSLVVNGFGTGVNISGGGATGNRIEGCYIGTNATGMSSAGNIVGVHITDGATGNIVGGTMAAVRNVIAGNLVEHVSITQQGTDGNMVQGNYIGLAADGASEIPSRNAVSIEIGAARNIVGGITAGARNVIVAYGTDSFAVRMRYDSHENIVQGNYIGSDKHGLKPVGKGFIGILVNKGAERNLIGGTVPGARNVVAAHSSIGIGVSFADNNVVQGNYIGTNPTGDAAVGKGDAGLCFYAGSGNLAGGTTPAARNIISGNYHRAVLLMSEPGTPETSNNVIQGNYIGTDATGRVAVGEQKFGVAMRGVVGNTIGLALDGSGVANRIAFSKGDGVKIYALPDTPLALQNTVRGNLIYGSGGLDINIQPIGEADFTVTPNDEGDVDDGPNNGQNSLLVTDVSSAGDKTDITATIQSTPNSKIIVDFYRVTTADAPKGEPGAAYLGSSEATTDAVGNAALTFNADVKADGGLFTATATNAATGDTSEFSARASSAIQ